MIHMWLPEWLGNAYCILYSNFKQRNFSFKEAKKVLGSSNSKLLKILSELNKNGFLLSRFQGRERSYVLSDFNSIALGITFHERFKDLNLMEKLRKSYGELEKPYMIVGSSAAFFYHGYQFPTVNEIEVLPDDYGFWKNFLPETKIKPELDERKFREAKVIDEIFVAPPERVIVDAIKNGGIPSAIDAVSVLISEGRRLNWGKLEEEAINAGVVNELGALLEALDDELKVEFGRGIMPKGILDDLFARLRGVGRIGRYPKFYLVEDRTYEKIGKRWRLKFLLPSYVIRKPIEDLAPLAMEAI